MERVERFSVLVELEEWEGESVWEGTRSTQVIKTRSEEVEKHKKWKKKHEKG
jgi:hypothetical protein